MVQNALWISGKGPTGVGGKTGPNVDHTTGTAEGLNDFSEKKIHDVLNVWDKKNFEFDFFKLIFRLWQIV